MKTTLPEAGFGTFGLVGRTSMNLTACRCTPSLGALRARRAASPLNTSAASHASRTGLGTAGPRPCVCARPDAPSRQQSNSTVLNLTALP